MCKKLFSAERSSAARDDRSHAGHPRPNPVTRVSKGGVCLFDIINLAQEARQSKPPLMHCADWAYNIIPAVTAMVRAAF